VEDQDHHGDNQKQVNQPAADVAEQAEKPENRNNDGYPKQHDSLLFLSRMATLILHPCRSIGGASTVCLDQVAGNSHAPLFVQG
jgi:hypothetical protein